MSEDIRPMTRDELVKELTELKGEISIVQDKIDLMCDEFQRIRSCPGADGEIKGLCDRAMKLIMISGKYTANSPLEISDNIARARIAATRLWEKGWAVICPHMNSAHMDGMTLAYEQFMAGYLEMLSRCDAVFMLKTWSNSGGSKREHIAAGKRQLPVYYELDGYPNAE